VEWEKWWVDEAVDGEKEAGGEDEHQSVPEKMRERDKPALLDCRRIQDGGGE
jgi:hypothetical protein